MPFRWEVPKEKFTSREQKLLERHGLFYHQVMTGFVPADNPDRVHFREVCERKGEPETEHERVWKKYLILRERHRKRPQTERDAMKRYRGGLYGGFGKRRTDF